MLTGTFALLGVIAVAFWIHGLDPRARVPRYAPWLFLVPAGGAAAAATLDPGLARVWIVLAAVLISGAVLVTRGLRSATGLLAGMAAITAGIGGIAMGVANTAPAQNALGTIVSNAPANIAGGVVLIAGGAALIAGRRILPTVVVMFGVMIIVGGVLFFAHAHALGAVAKISSGAVAIAVGAAVIMFAAGRRALAWLSIIVAGAMCVAGGAVEISQDHPDVVVPGVVNIVIGLAFAVTGTAAIVGWHRIRTMAVRLGYRPRAETPAGRRRILARVAAGGAGTMVVVAGTVIAVGGVLVVAIGAVIGAMPVSRGPGPVAHGQSAVVAAWAWGTGIAMMVAGAVFTGARAAAIVSGSGVPADRRFLGRVAAGVAGAVVVVAGMATATSIGLYIKTGDSRAAGWTPHIQMIYAFVATSMGAVGILSGMTVIVIGAGLLAGRRRSLTGMAATEGRRILAGVAATAVGSLEIGDGAVGATQGYVSVGVMVIACGAVVILAGAAFTVGRRVLAWAGITVAGVAFITAGILEIADVQTSILLAGVSHGQVLVGTKDIALGGASVVAGITAIGPRNIGSGARRVIEWMTIAPGS